MLILNIVRIVLESEGYFVLAANDGEEALNISRQYPGTIHALLSDVNMPNADGFQLREQILFERPGTKVLLMSATCLNSLSRRSNYSVISGSRSDHFHRYSK